MKNIIVQLWSARSDTNVIITVGVSFHTTVEYCNSYVEKMNGSLYNEHYTLVPIHHYKAFVSDKNFDRIVNEGGSLFCEEFSIDQIFNF